MFDTLSKLSNPSIFMKLADRIIPWLGGAALIVLCTGLYLSLFASPADYQQGETVRIMYIHVPMAWLSMACYTVMAISALGTLIWRHPLADVAARSAAPLGAVFTFLALVTGSLWGRPMWGTWWEWDARLTSVLILFIMYLGLIALWRAIDNATQAARTCAVFILVGFINIPIIHYSVDWWNTLHQPASVFRADGPTIHSSMLWPLLFMAAGFTLLFAVLHLMTMRNEIRSRQIYQIERRTALQGG